MLLVMLQVLREWSQKMHCWKDVASDLTPTAPALLTAASETHPQSVAACSSPSPADVLLPPAGASHQLAAEAESVSVGHLLDASTHNIVLCDNSLLLYANR